MSDEWRAIAEYAGMLVAAAVIVAAALLVIMEIRG
jgi:hypothetical protein